MSMLRNLRERKGLTVSQLAAKASIPSRVIADYEEGRQTITLTHAKLLAKALWVGIEDLMPPAGAIPPQPSQHPSSPAASATQHTAYTPPASSPRPAPAPPAPRTAGPPQGSAPAGYHQAPHAGGAGAATAPRTEAPRAPRVVNSETPSRGGSGQRGAARTRPAPPPPSPITSGQLEELQRLALKLDITQEQLEERVGKKLTELNRPEAKEWIKRARGMAEEIAPTRKVSFGKWPEAREDQEASYLKAQQEAQASFVFKLFNGEQFEGVISDFTPYTITIKPDNASDNDEMVLRKLAIAYYRRTSTPGSASSASAQARAQAQAPAVEAHEHARDNHHQPVSSEVESDRAGEPEKPETDNIDEDRGV